MTNYKGFRYEKLPQGWLIILPSGLRSKVAEISEQELRDGIDGLTGE